MRALAAVTCPPAGPRPLAGLPPAPGPLDAFGRRRDEARLLVVSRSGPGEHDAVFADLGRFLRPGDVLVVNTSATLPAAVPTEDGRLLHVSGEFLGGLRLVELRGQNGIGSRPFPDGYPGPVRLPGGGQAYLLAPYLGGPRLWVARLDLPGNGDLVSYLAEHGRPIRYGSPDRAWPLDAYQTVFATEPGSAEMPSAARGFTAELVTSLVAGGVVFAPIVLHCGVSSPETGEPPQPERYRVPASTAALVNAARAAAGRVVAVGTTATRALETTADKGGVVHPGEGWTELVITPERGVRAVDALITGWHEPKASHLDLIEAVAGRAVVERSYALAADLGYRGHEFGDFHLILP
jgi:S-adenosylmethionine:tRNA ribosyltransferase-isomerase